MGVICTISDAENVRNKVYFAEWKLWKLYFHSSTGPHQWWVIEFRCYVPVLWQSACRATWAE